MLVYRPQSLEIAKVHAGDAHKVVSLLVLTFVITLPRGLKCPSRKIVCKSEEGSKEAAKPAMPNIPGFGGKVGYDRGM